MYQILLPCVYIQAASFRSWLVSHNISVLHGVLTLMDDCKVVFTMHLRQANSYYSDSISAQDSIGYIHSTEQTHHRSKHTAFEFVAVVCLSTLIIVLWAFKCSPLFKHIRARGCQARKLLSTKMPPVRGPQNAKGLKTERTHEENQERLVIPKLRPPHH